MKPAAMTCEPNMMVREIHDRMPVILPEQHWQRWISDEPDPADLMKPFNSDMMTMWPIGSKVGNPRYNEPDILDVDESVPEPPEVAKPAFAAPKPEKPAKAVKPKDDPGQGSLF